MLFVWKKRKMKPETLSSSSLFFILFSFSLSHKQSKVT